MPARQPPEWAKHDWVWIGFPSHADLWLEDLDAARAEVIEFARGVHAGGKGEEVRLVAADPAAAEAARAMAGSRFTIVEEAFGDIWLRDTGPIIVQDDQQRAARCFRFNGWGGKYDLEGDDTIGLRLAETADLDPDRRDWILEGGAIEVDGSGLLVTTEQCLLNPNRNGAIAKQEVEQRLAADLGIERVLWLSDGLLNDHTDGHVDNLARFVGSERLAIPEPEADDPNADVYADARGRAEAFGLRVVPVPSPGKVVRDGEIIPASYMNFYVGNAAVAVPVYGVPNDEAAVKAIGKLFPNRMAIGIRADHVLTGGGSFHCISQQMPSA